MPKNAYPATVTEFTPALKKKFVKFLDKADNAVVKKGGRFMWFDETLKIIAMDNDEKTARAKAQQHYQTLGGSSKGKWVVHLRFRVTKDWKYMFVKNRGPIEIQAVRLKIQSIPIDGVDKIGFGMVDDMHSLLGMTYQTSNVHTFKLAHLKKVAKSALKGSFVTKMVGRYTPAELKLK